MYLDPLTSQPGDCLNRVGFGCKRDSALAQPGWIGLKSGGVGIAGCGWCEDRVLPWAFRSGANRAG